MADRDAFRPTEDSIAPLHRSGWSTGETAWHAISGGIVYQVDGSNSENQIRVAGATPREAWHRAVEAARGRRDAGGLAAAVGRGGVGGRGRSQKGNTPAPGGRG